MQSFDDNLEIPVTYNGQDLAFPAKLLLSGYTYKIQVEVNEELIMFEPDEEKNYRAILDDKQLEKEIKVDLELLRSIARVIESVVR